MLDIIDFILRIVLMGFFALFLEQSILNYNNAKKKGENQAKTYYLAYIIFFALNLINFIQTEIDIQYTNIEGESIFPDLGLMAQFGDIPTKTIIFGFILIPSLIPIIYIIEKRMLQFKKPYLTMTGVIITFLVLLTFSIPSIAPFTMPVFAIGLVVLIFSFIFFYIKLVIISDGEVRKSATFSLTGWILLVLGFLVVGAVIFIIDPNANISLVGILTHTISIIGLILIFYGSRIVKHYSTSK